MIKPWSVEETDSTMLIFAASMLRYAAVSKLRHIGLRVDNALNETGKCLKRPPLLIPKFMPIVSAADAGQRVTKVAFGMVR